MIQTISKRILDILQGDARLIAGGTIYTAGWSGTTRQKQGDTPQQGAVNLFDRTFEPKGSYSMPGIFLGMKALQAIDTLWQVTVAGLNRTHLRKMTLPLTIVTQGIGPTGIYAADDQRWQLAANVRAILFDHLLDNGNWYQLDLPGNQAGAQALIRYWESTDGQGDQAQTTAFAVLPFVVSYSWTGDTRP